VTRVSIKGGTVAELAESIELAVHRGQLRPGDQLPTVRGLATSLGVSPVTVASAYRSLGLRGLLVANGRRGTRVRAGTGTPYLSTVPVPEGVRNLALGNPDPELVPSLARGLRAVDPHPVLYGGRANLPELVELMRTQLRADGVAANRIAVVSGALDGIERALAAHCRPGDRVLVEDPGFPRLLDLLRALALELVPVAVDDRGPVPDSLASALGASVRAAVVTPRAQNPTGAALDEQRARALQKLLARYPDLLVVEDDYVGPVAGAPMVTLSGKLKKWAVVRSFSKVLGPDLRVAFLAGDEATVLRAESRLRLGAGWVSHILQRIVYEVLSDRATERTLERAARTYAKRRRSMIEALAAQDIHALGESGINVWVPVPEEVGVVRALLDAGWAVSAGERFRLRSGPGIRITVATLQDGEAKALAACLADSLRPAAWTHAG
jgi:DNA-binding transcriptional MocR family regulator